jgi:uncharacterized phage protein (predicted DNA packaging)
MIDRIKNYLRIAHDLDDEILDDLIKTSKSIISEKTGVEYNENDPIYSQALLMLVSYYYDNRTIITDKSVNTLPYTVDELLKTLAFRGEYVE